MMSIEQRIFECRTFLKTKVAFIDELKSCNPDIFYIALPSTTEAEWSAMQISPVMQGPLLCVYTNIETVNQEAKKNGSVLPNGAAMVVQVRWLDFLNKIVPNYPEFLLFARPPFKIELSRKELCEDLEEKGLSLAEPEEPKPVLAEKIIEPGFPGFQKPEVFKAVPELIKMFDCSDKSKICNLPSYSMMEQFPMLLDKLISVNEIHCADLDKAVGINDGLSQCIIKTPTIDLSKDVLKKILSYFGLGEYLYRFVGSSTELSREIKANSHIYQDKIINAKVSTKERFTLTDVKRAKDENGAFLYQLSMKSNARTLNFVVTSPLNFIIGKEYEICGLEPIGNDSTDGNLLSSKPVQVNTDNSVIEKAKEKYENAQREYLDMRKDSVIYFFKLHHPSKTPVLNLKECEALYTKLEKDDDLLDELFWTCKALKAKEMLTKNEEALRKMAAQPNPVEVGGYTAKTLHDKFKFPLYDVYFWLSDLRHNTKETKQKLVYLETEKPDDLKKQ